MGTALGPTRPDRLTIWPVEGDVEGAWEIRVGPVPGEDVARVIDEFVW